MNVLLCIAIVVMYACLTGFPGCLFAKSTSQHACIDLRGYMCHPTVEDSPRDILFCIKKGLILSLPNQFVMQNKMIKYMDDIK